MSKQTSSDVPREFAQSAREPQFLPHPLMDQLLQTVIALGAELWIERDRRMTLERVLVEQGVIGEDALEAYRPGADEQATRAEARSALVERTFGGLKDLPGQKPRGD